MHFEKTGGTTINHCLSMLFDSNEICPCKFHDISLWPSTSLEPYKFVSAHVDLIDLRHMPGTNCVITFLREPVERCLSLYSFWNAFRPEYINEKQLVGVRLARAFGLKGMFSLENYGQCGFLWNKYAKALAGEYYLSPKLHLWESNDQILDSALSNLEKLTFVGITEDMSSSFKYMSARLGVDNTFCGQQLNVTKERTVAEVLLFDQIDISPEIDAEALDIVAAANELDAVIYRAAAERFFGSSTVRQFFESALYPGADVFADESDGVILVRNTTGGPLTYGPYVRLYRGKYNVSFSLRLHPDLSPHIEEIGFVDVVSESASVTQSRLQVLRSMFNSAGKITVSLSFSVDCYIDNVEFRSFVYQNSLMIIEQKVFLYRDL